jgi:adenine-specific DNA-methyltransferase
MTCVVLGGSRHISKLTDEVQVRLGRIVQQEFRVVVGDANGADKALQKYLADQSYEQVEVFCSGSSPRNNLGHWTCRQVTTKARPGTFEFYAAKDLAMATEATVGFMLWDGESAGTMLNVWRLMQSQKTSLVYVQPRREFLQVRHLDGWRRLLGLAAAGARAGIEKRIRGETPAQPKTELPLFGPDLHAVGLS